MSVEFAKSISGHDKNQYYLIRKKEINAIYLVNGENRLLDHPKKKNPKHIQIIKNLPMEVMDILEQEVTNLTIKRAIKTYVKYIVES